MTQQVPHALHDLPRLVGLYNPDTPACASCSLVRGHTGCSGKMPVWLPVPAQQHMSKVHPGMDPTRIQRWQQPTTTTAALDAVNYSNNTVQPTLRGRVGPVCKGGHTCTGAFRSTWITLLACKLGLPCCCQGLLLHVHQEDLMHHRCGGCEHAYGSPQHPRSGRSASQVWRV